MIPPLSMQVVSAFKLLNGDDGTTRGQDKVRCGAEGMLDWGRRV